MWINLILKAFLCFFPVTCLWELNEKTKWKKKNAFNNIMNTWQDVFLFYDLFCVDECLLTFSCTLFLRIITQYSIRLQFNITRYYLITRIGKIKFVSVLPFTFDLFCIVIFISWMIKKSQQCFSLSCLFVFFQWNTLLPLQMKSLDIYTCTWCIICSHPFIFTHVKIDIELKFNIIINILYINVSLSRDIEFGFFKSPVS